MCDIFEAIVTHQIDAEALASDPFAMANDDVACAVADATIGNLACVLECLAGNFADATEILRAARKWDTLLLQFKETSSYSTPLSEGLGQEVEVSPSRILQ